MSPCIQATPVCGLGFQAGADGALELVSCGEEGRLCRFDVFGSSVEGGRGLHSFTLELNLSNSSTHS